MLSGIISLSVAFALGLYISFVQPTMQVETPVVEHTPICPHVEQPAKPQPPAAPSFLYQAEEGGITVVELVDRCIADKEKNLRYDTLRSYKCFARDLKKFVNTYYPGILAKNFTKLHAQEYINRKEESIREAKKKANSKHEVSARTINNSIKGMRQFFAWGIENDLIEENPFQKIKIRQVREKRRTLVDEEALVKINKYLRETNQKGFLLVCMLIYGGFIRPKELRNVQIGDIDLKRHSIRIRSEVAKTHNTREVGFTPEIEALMLEMRIMSYPAHYYLIGKDYEISPTISGACMYAKKWAKMREELGLPEEMQLYSLKDTGITTMLENGVAPIDVMKQAGHHDLSMTTRYASHVDRRLAQKMYDNGMSFGAATETGTE